MQRSARSDFWAWFSVPSLFRGQFCYVYYFTYSPQDLQGWRGAFWVHLRFASSVDYFKNHLKMCLCTSSAHVSYCAYYSFNQQSPAWSSVSGYANAKRHMWSIYLCSHHTCTCTHVCVCICVRVCVCVKCGKYGAAVSEDTTSCF